MATESPSIRGVRDWYVLGHNLKQYFEEVKALDCQGLIKILQGGITVPARGQLRTRKQLESLSRAAPPTLSSLRVRAPNEQTLQWMFIHRGFFESEHERVVWRELPSCCSSESADGWCDLLVFDESDATPVLVELKRGSADDPLTRVIFEVLWHWSFNMQHLAAFNSLLSSFGLTSKNPIRLAIAAPAQYYVQAKRKTRNPRSDDYETAFSWLHCLRQKGIVIDLYSVEDGWMDSGPIFKMWRMDTNPRCS